MVERTRARGVDAQVRSWDDLPPTGDFDAILCVGNSLAHARDRRRALGAMAGALRPGGTVILTSRNWERELAAGSRLEVEPRLVERGGRRALIARAWTIGEATRHEVAVALLEDDGVVTTVTETLTVWPFAYDALLDDLDAAGLAVAETTFGPDLDRYLVKAVRPL
jgi:SAM-dependent methyltransferase